MRLQILLMNIRFFKICALAWITAMMLVGCQPAQTQLTILSTTDTHSQIEPTDKAASKNADRGGYARRMGLIRQEREADPDLILLDVGDFSQGTPYFNFYRGRLEVEAMNRMGYDAATFGNHEFDNGLDTLVKLVQMADFPFVCANYDFSGTPLEGLVKPWVVLKKNHCRVGVFGLGVAPDDLISKKNFGGIKYLSPLPIINETAALLKNEQHCDVVICLSHLGSDGKGVRGHETERDEQLIPLTQGVDMFLSGHSHNMHQDTILNSENKPVLMVQSGKSGLCVGKTTISLAHTKKK